MVGMAARSSELWTPSGTHDESVTETLERKGQDKEGALDLSWFEIG